MDQISVVRPLKHFFWQSRPVVAIPCDASSSRRTTTLLSNHNRRTQGDIVKRAAGDSGSSDINSQTFRNAERSSVAYFPEAAAAQPFDPLQLLEEEDVSGGVWKGGLISRRLLEKVDLFFRHLFFNPRGHIYQCDSIN